MDACKLFNNLYYFSKVFIGLGIITSPAGNHSRPQSCNRCGERGLPLSVQPQKCETKAVPTGYKMGSCCACVLSKKDVLDFWSSKQDLSICNADHKYCSSMWGQEPQSIEFNSRKNCQHLTNWTIWNKRDKAWSSTTSIFKPSPSFLLELPFVYCVASGRIYCTREDRDSLYTMPDGSSSLRTRRQ